MKREVTVSKCYGPSTARQWRCCRERVIVVVLTAMVVSLLSCSTFKGSSEGKWTASFFMDPDRVWGAIDLSLVELDYEVMSENRPDGVIRARSEPAEDGTVIVLEIDQVVYTDDQVNVFVKPSFGGDGGDGGDASPDLLKAGADAFMTSLNAKLNG